MLLLILIATNTLHLFSTLQCAFACVRFPITPWSCRCRRSYDEPPRSSFRTEGLSPLDSPELTEECYLSQGHSPFLGHPTSRDVPHPGPYRVERSGTLARTQNTSQGLSQLQLYSGWLRPPLRLYCSRLLPLPDPASSPLLLPLPSFTFPPLFPTPLVEIPRALHPAFWITSESASP